MVQEHHSEATHLDPDRLSQQVHWRHLDEAVAHLAARVRQRWDGSLDEEILRNSIDLATECVYARYGQGTAAPKLLKELMDEMYALAERYLDAQVLAQYGIEMQERDPEYLKKEYLE